MLNGMSQLKFSSQVLRLDDSMHRLGEACKRKIFIKKLSLVRDSVPKREVYKSQDLQINPQNVFRLRAAD